MAGFYINGQVILDLFDIWFYKGKNWKKISIKKKENFKLLNNIFNLIWSNKKLKDINFILKNCSLLKEIMLFIYFIFMFEYFQYLRK